MPSNRTAPRVAIACGGTGGHLFPGLAVGEVLSRAGCAITLLVSPKEVDQHAVRDIRGMEIVTLPAVGFSGNPVAFARGFWRSFRAARAEFWLRKPAAVLAMGGFTSAPPALAGRTLGASVFLHESNTVPGRANRWLARWVREAFVGFEESSARLAASRVTCTGTPVRPAFVPGDTAASRAALGLDTGRPVLLVMGGSQGARGVNEAVLAAVPGLRASCPGLQFLHLTGTQDYDVVRGGYARLGAPAVVRPFLREMHLAMAAATAAVSRAGASSLAEIAAMRLPSLLVPYPAAADNHQWFNARSFAGTGAAACVSQDTLTSTALTASVVPLLTDEAVRRAMVEALARRDRPTAARDIGQGILAALGVAAPVDGVHSDAPSAPPAGRLHAPGRQPLLALAP